MDTRWTYRTIIKSIPLVVFLWIPFFSFSQPSDAIKKVRQLKKLGRTALIEIALEKIAEDQPFATPITLANFDGVSVKANAEELYVLFHHAIAYVPQNSIATYGIMVYFMQDKIDYLYKANPINLNYREIAPLFTEDDSTQTNIQFVIDSMHNDERFGDWNDAYIAGEIEMTIRDKDTFYFTEIGGESYYETFKVRKTDGVIYDLTLEYIESDPNETNAEKFKEVAERRATKGACDSPATLLAAFDYLEKTILEKGKELPGKNSIIYGYESNAGIFRYHANYRPHIPIITITVMDGGYYYVLRKSISRITVMDLTFLSETEGQSIITHHICALKTNKI